MRLPPAIFTALCCCLCALGFAADPAFPHLVARDDGRVLSHHVKSGQSWTLTASERLEFTTVPTVAEQMIYAEDAVVWECTQLRPDARYQLRVVYANVAHDRRQSLTANGTVIHAAAKLPRGETVTKVATLPATLTRDGRLRVTFTNEGGPSAMVSSIELWSDTPTLVPRLSLRATPTADGVIHCDVQDHENLVPAATTVTATHGDAEVGRAEHVDGTMYRITLPASALQDTEGHVVLTATSGTASARETVAIRRFPVMVVPPQNQWGPASRVDEPRGAFDSLGLSLFHLRQDAAIVARFHAYLRDRGISAESLLGDAEVPMPDAVVNLIVEPEMISQADLKAVAERYGWTWIPDGSVIRTVPSDGPPFTVPLVVPKAGRYRVWLRYRTWAGALAPASLRLYRDGDLNEAPIWDDEFNTTIAAADAFVWHDAILDLDAGTYALAVQAVPHMGPSWHAPERTPRKQREVDCVYLTEATWAEPPTAEQRAAMRDGTHPTDVQWVTQVPTTPADRESWRWSQVAPLSWERAATNPALFAAGYDFWRREILRIAQRDYSEGPRDHQHRGNPDYRDERRQVVYDEVWNMVGNPAYISRQVAALQSDVADEDDGHDWLYLYPGYFEHVDGQWQRSGKKLTADHAARYGRATQQVNLPRTGTWYVWVRFKNINYHEHFGVTVATDGQDDVTWERHKQLYPSDIERGAAWDRVGQVAVGESQSLAVKIWMNGFKNPRTYRGVLAVFLTTDPDYQPRAELEPALTRRQYAARLERLNLDETAPFVMQKLGGIQTVMQTWWPAARGGVPEGYAGWTQVATDNCGVAAESPHLRQGDAWALTEKEQEAGRALDYATRSFAYHGESIRLAYRDLRADSQYRLRLRWFNVAHERRVSIRMNGKTVGRETLPLNGLLVRDYAFRGDQLADGVLDVEIAREDGGSAILSAAELWCDQPSPDVVMARGTTVSSGLAFRSTRDGVTTVRITPGPLVGAAGRFDGAVTWRAVAYVPAGDSRAAWSPFLLMQRPYLSVPPLNVAQAWFTIDSSGVPPGDYQCTVRLESWDRMTNAPLPEREMVLRVRVSPVVIAPQQPVLVGGYTSPPAGEAYMRDWAAHGLGIWYANRRLLSKAEMERYGVHLQATKMQSRDPKRIRAHIAHMQAQGLDFADWYGAIFDEPSGSTANELGGYIQTAQAIDAVEPRVQVSFNPGEAATLQTFQILAPYCDLWIPYALHLTYANPGAKQAIYAAKPWLYYTTPCYGDKAAGLPHQMYQQIRRVPSLPGNCRGTAFFALYYPWRDPWDTRFETIHDVSVFVLPSRHGPVATPSWEAIRDAIHHANLARMVREVAPDDPEAARLVAVGSVAQLLAWLERR